MNKSPLTTILLAILVISALASVGLCYLYTRNAIRLVDLQKQVAFAQTRNVYISGLVKDVMDYSSKNPAVDPILESANLKPSKAAQAPAAKTPGK